MLHTSAINLLRALRTREVSAVELVDESIARIRAVDARLNAVVVRDFDRAREAAAQADAARSCGDERPLLGLPMTVKESFDVAGLPTTWGIPGAGSAAADHDAVPVARLRSAGAVILGKTNVAMQLADWQSTNPVYGTTNNPWDLARTPGGSSGGAAAALASGMVPLELGSDLAGSLRVPAHCCGVYAHKPTHGLVPMRGHAPPGTPFLSVGRDIDLAVVGPMARSAGDLSLALGILAGPDEVEAIAYRLELPAARHERLGDYRVLVLDSHPIVPVGTEVRSAVHRFAGSLERVGCRVGWKCADLPDLRSCAEAFNHLLMSFVGGEMPQAEYRGIAAAAAQLPRSASDPASAQLRALVSSHRDWIAMDRMRLALREQWRHLFRDWDVVVCPALPVVAFTHDHTAMDQRTIAIDGAQLPYGLLGIWSGLASAAGLPATAAPIGLGAQGLPIGVQIIGPQLEDRTTLRFAELAEQAFGGFVAPSSPTPVP